MNHTLRVGYNDVKRFIEWSFFIEEGAVDINLDGSTGPSTVEKCEVNLSNKLLGYYRKMRKARKKDTELFYDLPYNEAEILRSWYYRIPECLAGEADADAYTRLSVFMVGEER